MPGLARWPVLLYHSSIMHRYAVIGLGRFGGRLASNLAAAGAEVIAIDRDLALIDAIRDRVTLAIALEATDEQALQAHGIDHADAAVVSIGDNFEATTLATVLLKQMGVTRVISRAVTPMSARILTTIGADEVVSPEDESADRWCAALMNPDFRAQHTFSAGRSVVQLKTPAAWVGKALVELIVRAATGILVIAARQRVSAPGAPDRQEAELIAPDVPLEAVRTLVVAGPDAELAKLST